MGITCNVTALGALTQMDSHLYYLVKLTTLCVSYTLNTVLSIPLLLAITRFPSLLIHTRFFILTHLLCCDSLQLLLMVAKNALLTSWQGLPMAQCLVFRAAQHACSMVDLLLSTSLALDRLVAVKWPLHYGLLVYPRRQRIAVGLIWTISVLLSIVAMCMALSSMEVTASLPRCQSFILAPCLPEHSALMVFWTVVVLGCYLTTLGCVFLLCWDTRGMLCSRRAGVTLGLQATQLLFYSVPVLLDSYLLPLNLYCDELDIALTTTYNLGISLIPLVYGYRSRELQRRLIQVTQRNTVSSIS